MENLQCLFILISRIDIKNDHFESKEEIPKVDQTEKNYKKKLLFNQYSNAFYRLKINYFKQKDMYLKLIQIME